MASIESDKSDLSLRASILKLDVQSTARALLALWVKVAPIVSPILLILFMVAISIFSYLRPDYGWDALPYLAAALQNSMSNIGVEQLHAEIYQMAKEALSASAFAAIAEGDAYRVRQFTDPLAFQSMMSLYEVKWLYVRLLMGLMTFMPPFDTIFAVNFIALAILTISLFAWMSRHKLWAYMPIVIALLMICRLPELVQTSTPDLLCVALLVSALLLLDRGRVWGASLIFMIATLARPDMVVLPLVLWASLGLVRDPRFGALTLAAIGAFAAYWFASHAASGHPGWWAHLWFSTYQMQDTMVGFQPDFSLQVYMTAFAYNLARSVTENIWFGLWFAAMIGWLVMLAKGCGRKDGRDIIIGACLAAVAAKFIVFPLHDARTYLPILLPAILLMGASLVTYIKSPTSYIQKI